MAFGIAFSWKRARIYGHPRIGRIGSSWSDLVWPRPRPTGALCFLTADMNSLRQGTSSIRFMLHRRSIADACLSNLEHHTRLFSTS